MTVDKILDNYGSYVRGELGLSDATVNTYVYQLKTFMHFLSGRNVTFTDFTVDDFEAFLAYVVDELRQEFSNLSFEKKTFCSGIITITR